MPKFESAEVPYKTLALIIHYNARLEGRNFFPGEKLKYAMVVTVQAKSAVDLYNQVVRQYSTQIEPLRPILEIPVRA